VAETPAASRELPAAEEVQTDVGPLLLPLNDGVMKPLIAATGDWEINEATIVRAHLRPGMTFVDIGAHVGYYTNLAAREVGTSGHVYAVEPDPDNAALLRENVRRNGYRNVTVIEAAAWHETTTVTLRRDHFNTGDNRVADQFADDGAVCEVEGIAFDDRLAGLEVSAVKVDAQGVDHLALRGMRETIQRCRPIVFVEFWPDGIRENGGDPAAVIEEYRGLGYRITMIGYDTDFAAWPAEEIVRAAEGFPFGAVALVLRPRYDTDSNTA
jgi:FkbM family methyltransferase